MVYRHVIFRDHGWPECTVVLDEDVQSYLSHSVESYVFSGTWNRCVDQGRGRKVIRFAMFRRIYRVVVKGIVYAHGLWCRVVASAFSSVLATISVRLVYLPDIHKPAL